MSFANLLVGLASPIATRVLIALGISVVTYTGLDLIIDQIINYVTSSLGNMMAAKAAQIAAMYGFPQAVGIILAAITTKLAMAQLTDWLKS